MIKISGISVEGYLERMHRELDQTEHFVANISQFDPIEDIVEVGGLWHWSTGLEIDLKYRGNAETEYEARSDLANIMRALKVVFGDLFISKGKYTYIPTAKYIGTGMLGDREVDVELRVPWHPDGCKIEEMQIEKPGFNVVCMLEKA